MKILIYLPVVQVQGLLLVEVGLKGRLYAGLPPLGVRLVLARVRPAPLAAASQGCQEVSLKADVLGLVVLLEVEDTLLLQLK
jgi:hypothetical protein